MSVPNLYVLHGVRLPSGTLLGQLVQLQQSNRVELVLDRSAGITQTQFAAMASGSPDITAVCTQVKTILDLCGHKCFATLDGNTDLYFRQASHLGDRMAAGGASHLRLRATKAILCWRRLSCSQGGTPGIEIMIRIAADGANAPVAIAAGQALAGSWTAAEQFTLGPLGISGSAVSGVVGMVLDTGYTMFGLGSDGELYPTFLGLQTWTPMLLASLVNGAVVSGYGPDISACTGWTQYLRRRTANNKPYANDQSQHIAISATQAGPVVLEQIEGGGNGRASAMLRLPALDNTSAEQPLTIATTSQIT